MSFKKILIYCAILIGPTIAFGLTFFVVLALSQTDAEKNKFHPEAPIKFTNYTITRVIDGDTVEFLATFLPKELGPTLKLRIEGVDTPEKNRPRCEKEKKLAIAATEYTKGQLNDSSTITIILHKWDKYGGRVLGDIIYDNKRLSEELIKNNFAMAYDGRKKGNWCR